VTFMEAPNFRVDAERRFIRLPAGLARVGFRSRPGGISFTKQLLRVETGPSEHALVETQAVRKEGAGDDSCRLSADALRNCSQFIKNLSDFPNARLMLFLRLLIETINGIVIASSWRRIH
jgi:hypothetical protein